MSETELFQSYESEYFEKSREISQELESAKKLSGERRKAATRRVQKLLGQAKSIMGNMEMEANSLNTYETREMLKKRLRTYKQDMAKLRRDYEDLSRNRGAYASDSRGVLFEGAYDDDLDSTSHDHRERLVQNTRRLDKSTESLHRSRQLLNEVESQAMDTAAVLGDQGNQIRRTIERTQDIQVDVRQGGRTISLMGRRQVTNKLIIVGVILALIVAILIVLAIILYPLITSLIDLFKPAPQPAN